MKTGGTVCDIKLLSKVVSKVLTKVVSKLLSKLLSLQGSDAVK